MLQIGAKIDARAMDKYKWRRFDTEENSRKYDSMSFMRNSGWHFCKRNWNQNLNQEPPSYVVVLLCCSSSLTIVNGTVFNKNWGNRRPHTRERERKKVIEKKFLLIFWLKTLGFETHEGIFSISECSMTNYNKSKAFLRPKQGQSQVAILPQKIQFEANRIHTIRKI